MPSIRRFPSTPVAYTCLTALVALAGSGCLVASQVDTPDGGGTTSGPGTVSTGSTGPASTSTGSGSGSTAHPGTDGGGIPLPTGAAGDASTGTSPPGTADAAGGTTTPPASGSGYNIDIAQTSVSGFSSGAFFAVQFHVAFSSIMKGAAVFAGGPYACAQGSATTAETTCMTGSPTASALVTLTKQNFAAGGIDDPANLANERVFLFGGADDSVVHPTVVDSLQAYYASFMGASSIQYESRHAGASHTMPTTSFGGTCDAVTAPYVGKCGYDGAGAALKQIYGTLAAPASTPGGQILSFPQSDFVSSPATVGLGPTGYYYVPSACANGEACKIHVSFHGCQQNAALVNDAYYGHAGYNEWADTNHIIVLYPQAASSSGNSYECWDFWGYDGANYAEKAGTQVAAVRAMIDWVAKGGAGSSGSGTGSGSGAGTGTGSGVGTGSGTGTAACVTAANTAQVAAGRAYALAGFAYATGSNAFLGADNATTTSSLQQTAAGYYATCL